MLQAFILAFILLVLHFVFDFIFQDEDWAVNKSKSIVSLVKHTTTYSLLWTIPMFFMFMYVMPNLFMFQYAIKTFDFVVITFLAHTLTDYHTSKVTSRLYAKGKFGSSIPNLGFFSMIGFDQVLHYAQLFITFLFLINEL